MSLSPNPSLCSSPSQKFESGNKKDRLASDSGVYLQGGDERHASGHVPGKADQRAGELLARGLGTTAQQHRLEVPSAQVLHDDVDGICNRGEERTAQGCKKGE